MRLRFPLYGKVLFWFFVNLLLIAALAAGFVRMQFRLRMDWLLAGPAGERLEAMSEVIAADLRERPVARWNEVLERYHTANGATFALFRGDAQQLAGPPLDPPTEVREKLHERRGPPNNPRPPPPPPRREDGGGDRHGPPGQGPTPPPTTKLLFFLRAGDPAKYWAGLRIDLPHEDPVNSRNAVLAIVGDSITGGGLFFEPWPWVMFAAAAIVLSALVWLPIVGGITRAIRRMNAAARSIAEGRFEVRVPEERRDELGELAGSVNTMAEQLGDLVERQRRLTADVAHELCSPIARMQRALGVVEQRGTPEQAGYLEKLDRELQHMAGLVEEVLSFSKAATVPQPAMAENFALADLVADIAAREAVEAHLEVRVPPELRLHTFRETLDRALANVIRNAVRYAGQAGPIEVEATKVAENVVIAVRDHGPGVPADALEQIFEPFYRPAPARQRATGGAGLGLAIVRRCVEACGGTATAMLAEGDGLRVILRIPQVRGDGA